MIKVYFAVNESGVNYWRGKVPGHELRKQGLADIRMFSVFDHTQEQAEREVAECDVIYMPCATGMEALLEIVHRIKNDQSVVVDYDDNLFDCHPYNPGYATLGLYEVTIENSTKEKVKLWQDQRHGFSLEDNRKRYYAHIDILNTANQITTTTPKLKSSLLEYVDRDQADFNIIPNAINFDTFRPFREKKRTGNKIRIGWTASDSHIVEGRFIMRILNGLVKKRSDFEFVILGNVEKLRWVGKEANFDIEWHEFTDISVYPLKLASLEFDIGIVPLEDHSFNLCKSALKWSEYSALKIPSVVSDLDPYNCVKDRIDGLKAHNEEAFIARIEELMDDAQLRNKIAQNAYERNRSDFNIQTVSKQWLEVFERAHLKPHTVTYKGEPLKPLVESHLNLSGMPLDVRRPNGG